MEELGSCGDAYTLFPSHPVAAALEAAASTDITAAAATAHREHREELKVSVMVEDISKQ